MWTTRVGSAWDLLKRAVLGAVLGLVALIIIAPVVATLFEPLLPAPADVPAGILAGVMAVFPVSGAFIAVAWRKRFGRRTRAIVIGMALGGVAGGIIGRCSAPEHLDAKSQMVRANKIVRFAVPVGCVLGAAFGYSLAV